MKYSLFFIICLVLISINIYGSKNDFTLEFLWRDVFDNRMLTNYANPLIYEDKIYFVVRNVEGHSKGDFENDYINVYDINDGIVIKRLKTKTSSSMVNPIQIGDLIVFSLGENIVALRNDEVVWKKSFDRLIGDIVNDEEYIYVNALLKGKHIIKLNIDGKIKWAFSQENKNFYGLKQDNNYIYTTESEGTEINYICKINKRTGQIEMKIKKNIRGNLLVNNKYIIVDSFSSIGMKKLYVYDKNTGEKVKTIIEEEVLLVSDDYIICKGNNKTVCLDANTFEKLWESTPLVRLTLYKDKLYGYKSMGPFIVMDVRTGEIIWQDENNRDEDYASGTTPVANEEYVITITEADYSHIWVYKKKQG